MVNGEEDEMINEETMKYIYQMTELKKKQVIEVVKIEKRVENFYTVFRDPDMYEIIFNYQKKHFINLQKELKKKKLETYVNLTYNANIKDLKVGDIVTKTYPSMGGRTFFKIIRFTKCYMFIRKVNQTLIELPMSLFYNYGDYIPIYYKINDTLDENNPKEIKMKITSSITSYIDKTKDIVIFDNIWYGDALENKYIDCCHN